MDHELEVYKAEDKRKKVEICEKQLRDTVNLIAQLGCKLNIVEIRINGNFLKYEFQITAD